MKLSSVLPALPPVVVGLVLPMIAFSIAQHANAYVRGQDEDLDEMVSQAANALPLITAFTVVGFLGLAGFLLVQSTSFPTGFLWVTSIVGTIILAAIVLSTHPGMYDLLYSRGRMHSTSGVAVMFVSFYCVVASIIVAAIAWTSHRVWRNRRSHRQNEADPHA